MYFIRSDDTKWLIFSLNGNFVKYHTGELINSNLEEILSYLKENNLLHKTIIIGSRVIQSTYKVCDHHLNKKSFNQIKEHFHQLNYIELNDVNAWEPEDTINQFKNKIPNFVNTILSRKENK